MEIEQIGNIALKTLNSIGKNTINTVKGAANTVKTKVSGKGDSFEFVNNIKEKGIGKETIVGAGVITAGLVLAYRCLKGINNSIRNLNNKN